MKFNKIAPIAALTAIFLTASALAQNNRAATLILPPAQQNAQPVSFNFEHFVDKEGQTLSAQDIEGKYVMLYGGYLECTGICPGAADSIVGALKHLKANNPALAASIVPVVVMIRNNEDGNLADAKARAATWQTEGLEGAETGIRVFVTERQENLEAFKQAFSMQITTQNGGLVHSPWAYLFGTDGKMLSQAQGDAVTYRAGLVQTQQGKDVIVKALTERVTPVPQPQVNASQNDRQPASP